MVEQVNVILGRKFTKKDLWSSIVTGLTTGVIAWRIFEFLNVPEVYGLSFRWLIILVPILWILGVNLGYFLGRWFSFFTQFGKFVAIGFTNASIDFGALNLMISIFGIAAGVWFSVFKTISFILATIHSYFWNKYWSFEAGESKGGAAEVVKFFSVAAVSILVNVAVASVIVNLVHPLFGVTPEVWANIGAVAGSATALIFSFVGFKIVVFKK